MQRNYNLGSLLDWYPVQNGSPMRFDLPASGSRRVDFQLLADADVSVIAETTRTENDEHWLVGYGSGLLECKFGIHEPVTVTVSGPDGCSIWIKTRLLTQVLDDTKEPSWTVLEPRRMSQTEKITHMQAAMAVNAQRRNAAILAEMEERASLLDAKLAALKAAEDASLIEGGGDAD